MNSGLHRCRESDGSMISSAWSPLPAFCLGFLFVRMLLLFLVFPLNEKCLLKALSTNYPPGMIGCQSGKGHFNQQHPISFCLRSQPSWLLLELLAIYVCGVLPVVGLSQEKRILLISLIYCDYATWWLQAVVFDGLFIPNTWHQVSIYLRT